MVLYSFSIFDRHCNTSCKLSLELIIQVK